MAGVFGLYLAALFVLWLGLALGCGFGARSIMAGKGRSGSAGFWLGFCLGLTGLLIAALLSSTPEHEARKLQQQMQLMGMVAPPPGMPYAVQPGMGSGAGWPPIAPMTRPDRGPLSSAVFALVVSGLAVLLALGGQLSQVATLVALVGVGLAVAAIVTKKVGLIGLASGVGLATQGLGVAELWAYKPELFFVPFAVAIVGSAMIVFRSYKQAADVADSWWKPAVCGTAGVGVALTWMTSEQVGTSVALVAGFVVAGAGLLWADRAATMLAAGWAGTTLVGFLVSDPPYRSFDRPVALLAVAGVLGLAVWLLQHVDWSVETLTGNSPGDMQTFTAAPPPPPPASYAPAPSPPTAQPPSSMTPAWSMPSSLWSTSVATDALSTGLGDATVRRPGVAQQSAIRLRFASGDAVAIAGALVLGRAPVVPLHLEGAAVHAVTDPSMAISSTHCVVTVAEGSVWVEDLGSTNGTDLVLPNGAVQMLRAQRAELARGCRLQLGDNWCQLDE